MTVHFRDKPYIGAAPKPPRYKWFSEESHQICHRENRPATWLVKDKDNPHRKTFSAPTQREAKKIVQILNKERTP